MNDGADVRNQVHSAAGSVVQANSIQQVVLHSAPECGALTAMFSQRADIATFTGRDEELHWIEAEFAALRYFALNGTDHRTHAERNAAIGAYIRWHNTQAEPKTGFATDSPIRTWTHYPTKVA